MATIITPSHEELLAKVGLVLAEGNPAEMRRLCTALSEAKGEFDWERPEEKHAYYLCYGAIGQLRDAISSVRERVNDVVTRLKANTERALDKNTLSALIPAKVDVKAEYEKCSDAQTSSSLKALLVRLNRAIDALNNVQARVLLDCFNAQSKQVWRAIEEDCLELASDSYNLLVKAAVSIIEPKPFMRFAIERVEEGAGGWEAVKRATIASLANTQGDLFDLELVLGRKYQNEARGLKGRLDANMANDNTGAAMNAFNLLCDPNVAAGLACLLGSCTDRDDYMQEAAVYAQEHRQEAMTRCFARISGRR